MHASIYRRLALAAVSFTLAAPLALAMAGVAPAVSVPTAAGAALPTVDMELVVRAAQIDPRRPDSVVTAGAGPSVRAVEAALADRDLLAEDYVDGHFGTRTVTAYAAWQRSLGFSGLDASGLPGTTSLRSLGRDRYSLTRTIGPGAKVTVEGTTVNTRTRSMLVEAERLLGRDLVLTQGSYNEGGDTTSAGTHDGGGTIDLSVRGLDSAARVSAVEALRRVGFAAWLRSPQQGDWPWHIHAVAIDDTDLSAAAQHQIGDYFLGLNGLANRAADDGPRVAKRSWEEYLQRQ